jgi:hippurate hydrolase
MKFETTMRAVVALLISTSAVFAADSADIDGRVNNEYPSLFELYKTLHAAPELSYHEEKTSERLAQEWEHAGYQVTRHVGGFGVVAVLKNGSGPTLLLRTELDALPVTEETGLPYASKVTATDEFGKETGVMHACGHDIHMASVTGAGRLLAQLTNEWHGTLVLIAQPAEERGGGAKAMLADGLFQRFPKPDYCVAFHDSADAPAGIITYCPGYSTANADSVEITVRGVGGHGAHPDKAKDPVLLAAQIIVALQTIVSRETRPGEEVVVTVGTIHGGTKNNIIPDEVKIQLTVRTFGDESRKKTLAAVKRIALGCAATAGIPDDLMPLVKFGENYTPSLYNDPKLTACVIGVLNAKFGETNVWVRSPGTGAEDFSRYGRTDDKIPIFMFSVGAVNSDTYKKSQTNNQPLPSLHSPRWAPDPDPTIKAGVTALTVAALKLVNLEK